MKSYLNEYHVSILKYLRSQAHGVSITNITNYLNLKIENIKNNIEDLKGCGLIKHDCMSVTSNIMWNDSEVIYYTVEDKREAIDRLQFN